MSSPVSYHSISCFCCLSTGKVRSFKIFNQKCKDSNALSKLGWVFISEFSIFQELTRDSEISICRVCFHKLESAHAFREMAVSGATKFLEARNKQKRLAHGSPEFRMSKCKTRRKLNMGHSNEEHSYVKNQSNFADSQIIPPLGLKVKHLDHSQREILQNVEETCSKLCGTDTEMQSRLSTGRDINDLASATFIEDIYQEMKKRVPFLLNLFSTIAGLGKKESIHLEDMAPLISCYSILLYKRCPRMGAWHRMVTCVLLRCHLEEQGYRILNNLGLCQSQSTKLRIQALAVRQSHARIVDHLKRNPLIKITGDNLDVYVRAAHQAVDQQHRDLHLFASNVIFSRAATTDMSTERPRLPPKLAADTFLPAGDHQETLLHGYAVLIGRIIKEIPALSWLKVPDHILHRNSRTAAEKTTIMPLPIMFYNEAKHEDCVSIMQEYEDQLHNLFTEAHGNTSALDRFGVPVGGDQLTRVRLEEAKLLRELAPNARRRLDHLNPVMIEWWHNKQDLLEKAYKSLYDKASIREAGTLYFFKSKFQLSDVSGSVKKNFKAHHDLLVSVGKALISEQAWEYFDVSEDGNEARQNLPGDQDLHPQINKEETSINVIKQFMRHFSYGNLKFKEDLKRQDTFTVFTSEHQGTTQVTLTPKRCNNPDEVYNYCSNLCHWALHIMALDDTSKEADGERLIANAMYSIPLFFSHSHLSKYLVENLDFLLKVLHKLSPLQRSLCLDTAFVNTRGGRGKNVEADLCQEHSVRNQKALIKSLGANKNNNAIMNATASADAICCVVNNLRDSLNIPKPSTRHSKKISSNQEASLKETLRTLRPFKIIRGRKCSGFSKIQEHPAMKFSKTDLIRRMQQVVDRLYGGQILETETDDSESEGDSDGLPDI